MRLGKDLTLCSGGALIYRSLDSFPRLLHVGGEANGPPNTAATRLVYYKYINKGVGK